MLQPVEGRHSLKLNFSGLLCCQGSLRVALYQDEDLWLRDEGMVRGRIVIVQNDEEEIEIHGLGAGRYAIAAYQDKNSNGRLDRWFWLLPREPYGFSNNVGRFGPASFNAAVIKVPDVSELDINIRTLTGPKK